jgi:hypothetical protein
VLTDSVKCAQAAAPTACGLMVDRCLGKEWCVVHSANPCCRQPGGHDVCHRPAPAQGGQAGAMQGEVRMHTLIYTASRGARWASNTCFGAWKHESTQWRAGAKGRTLKVRLEK